MKFKWAMDEGEVVGVDVLIFAELSIRVRIFFGWYAEDSGSVASNKILAVDIWLTLSSIV